jgi:DNA-binding LacI/PurR family transcriptional regulator
MAKKPTLHRIAELAKVSPATVTRVAAGNTAVDPAMRDRVLRTAEKLGIDFEDRRRDKSRIIGFLLGNREVLHDFQARLLVGAERYCAQHEWQLLFMTFHYTATAAPEALHVPQLQREPANVHAVIVSGHNHPNLIEMLAQRKIPCSVLGNNVSGEWSPDLCDVVYSDDIRGAYDATRHLVASGHQRVSFVGNTDLPWFARCAQGYTRAMNDSGLSPHCINLRSDGTELGYLGGRMLLASAQHATAVVAGSDQVASGLYSAFREDGLSVPGDMSVVSINDTDASLFHPGLTSVKEFPEELGRQLAEFAINRLRNPGRPPQQVTIPTRLQIRQSVATLLEKKSAV